MYKVVVDNKDFLIVRGLNDEFYNMVTFSDTDGLVNEDGWMKLMGIISDNRMTIINGYQSYMECLQYYRPHYDAFVESDIKAFEDFYYTEFNECDNLVFAASELYYLLRHSIDIEFKIALGKVFVKKID